MADNEERARPGLPDSRETHGGRRRRQGGRRGGSRGLEGRPDDFDWDAGNRTKNLKREVNPADVEALLAHPILFAGRIVEPAHDRKKKSTTKAKPRRTGARPASRRAQFRASALLEAWADEALADGSIPKPCIAAEELVAAR